MGWEMSTSLDHWTMQAFRNYNDSVNWKPYLVDWTQSIGYKQLFYYFFGYALGLEFYTKPIDRSLRLVEKPCITRLVFWSDIFIYLRFRSCISPLMQPLFSLLVAKLEGCALTSQCLQNLYKPLTIPESKHNSRPWFPLLNYQFLNQFSKFQEIHLIWRFRLVCFIPYSGRINL